MPSAKYCQNTSKYSIFLEIYGLEAPERVMVSTGAGPCQMSMMKFSAKIVNGEKLFTIFTKILHQRFD